MKHLGQWILITYVIYMIIGTLRPETLKATYGLMLISAILSLGIVLTFLI